ncbi:MAG: tripartite tricarboxylate transporter TctB family protein [Deltaproteobacteria bacterium]|nr:tripartite tricarboxylate transporter TctB family protein [Deltaproteobacteria bacterium]
MRIKSQKDFFAGLMFFCVGAAFAWGATTYGLGTAARIGPGRFPLILGVLTAILGAVIVFKSLVIKTKDGDKIGALAWKPLFFIIAANLVFGLMLGGLPRVKLPAMGLIVGIYALTFIASLAEDEFKVKQVAILATVLAVMSFLAFRVLLKLQFPAWPPFITG